MLWINLCYSAILVSYSYAFRPGVSPRQPNTQLYKKAKRSSGGGFGGSSTTTTSFPYAGDIRPGKLSPQRVVLNEEIVKPDYWDTGVPKSSSPMLPWMIEVKSDHEIARMRESGVLARHILDMAGRAVTPGITTDEIDTIVHDEIVKVRI